VYFGSHWGSIRRAFGPAEPAEPDPELTKLRADHIKEHSTNRTAAERIDVGSRNLV